MDASADEATESDTQDAEREERSAPQSWAPSVRFEPECVVTGVTGLSPRSAEGTYIHGLASQLGLRRPAPLRRGPPSGDIEL